MFARFTPEARRTIELAQAAATELGHGFLGSGHLLLGILRQSEETASRLLATLGLDYEHAATTVDGLVGDSSEPLSGRLDLTPDAKKTLEMAPREAMTLQGADYAVRPEHILLAIVYWRDTPAVAALDHLGLGREHVRAALLATLEAPGA